MVGPDLRRFYDNYVEILEIMRRAIADRHGNDLADEFFADYCSILAHLVVVNRLTRKTDLLSDAEIVELDLACKGFGTTFRLVDAKRTYPPGSTHKKGTLTAKGHVIEKHVIHYARRFGTCGAFGEDGLEALHPLDTAARLLTRSIRNNALRINATANRLALVQGFRPRGGK